MFLIYKKQLIIIIILIMCSFLYYFSFRAQGPLCETWLFMVKWQSSVTPRFWTELDTGTDAPPTVTESGIVHLMKMPCAQSGFINEGTVQADLTSHMAKFDTT